MPLILTDITTDATTTGMFAHVHATGKRYFTWWFMASTIRSANNGGVSIEI